MFEFFKKETSKENEIQKKEFIKEDSLISFTDTETDKEVKTKNPIYKYK